MSKKLPGIRVFAVELEIWRQPTAKGPHRFNNLAARLPSNAECALASHVYLNLVAFLEPQSLHHSRGKANGEAVAPFCDLHDLLLGYTFAPMYIHRYMTVKDTP